MFRKILLLSLACITMLGFSACDILRLLQPVDGDGVATSAPTTDPRVAVDTAAAATFAIQTLVVQAVQQTLAAAQSDTPLPTPTITFTPTLSLTPSLTYTLTVEFPMVTVSSITNCRSGPGRSFDLIAVLQPGESTQVVGRTTVANYWFVRSPENPVEFCWLWGQYATVTGDWTSLPIVTPPPTPTPLPVVRITYLGMITCSGRSFRFEIRNGSDIIWESIRLAITDLDTSTTVIYTSNAFRDFSGCTLTENLLDLTPGEVGVVVNETPSNFSYNPAGHNMKAVFTLYVNNGFSGYSETITIPFKP